jgi:hypothetical protein
MREGRNEIINGGNQGRYRYTAASANGELCTMGLKEGRIGKQTFDKAVGTDYNCAMRLKVRLSL